MALEPKVVSLEDERNPELEDMTRRFWICLGPSPLGHAPGYGGYDSWLVTSTDLHRLDEELGAMAAGDAGGALGRLAVFPARVGFGR